MDQLIEAVVSGLALAAPLFLGASGLAMIFGVMHTFDFSYGALFMYGAYLVVTILDGEAVGVLVFGAAVIGAALVVGAVAGFNEWLVFRRLAGREHITTMLGSFALLLVLTGIAATIWGPAGRTQAQTRQLDGSVTIGGAQVATYDLALIGVGAVVGVGMYVLMTRTRFGLEMRAVAHDRSTASALGVRSTAVGAGVFVVGGMLAGLAGGLSAPLYAITPELAAAFILQSFIVVVIGGLGSIPGAVVASLLLGTVNGFLVVFLPEFSDFGIYAVTALVLLVRPQGLFGLSEKVAA